MLRSKLAMPPFPLLAGTMRSLLPIAIMCGVCSEGIPGGLPFRVPLNQIEHNLTSCTEVSSMGYYGGRLFIATTVGLLELKAGAPINLYVWDEKDPPVEAVWTDDASNQLWVMLPDADRLQILIGEKWSSEKFPRATKGYISRGDMWQGFRGVSHDRYFYIEGAGRLWQWRGPRKHGWSEMTLPQELCPTTSAGPRLKRFIPLGAVHYYIRRDPKEPGTLLKGVIEALNLPGATNAPTEQVFSRSGTNLLAITNRVGPFSVADAISGTQRAFLRTTGGRILEITPLGIEELATPGHCDALARSGPDMLVGVFTGLGVFQFSGNSWLKISDLPFPVARDHTIILAAALPQMALAANSIPTVRAMTTPAACQLWVSAGAGWTAVLPQEAE